MGTLLLVSKWFIGTMSTLAAIPQAVKPVFDRTSPIERVCS
jgi:hypothetical protein